MAKMKPILEAVHVVAKDMHELGHIDARTMREFDAMCLPPVKTYKAKQIKQLRARINVSQGVFAAHLNVSPSTVKQWETGGKLPSGPSLKLLNLVDKKGLEALTW